MPDHLRFGVMLRTGVAIALSASVCYWAQATVEATPPTPTVTCKTGDWVVEWNEMIAKATNLKTKEEVVIYEDHSETWTEGEENQFEGYYSESYGMLSIVGTIVSYLKTYEGSGGAHPIYGSSIFAVDLQYRGTSVKLSDLFPAPEIAQALMAAPEIRAHLTADPKGDLTELCNALDGGCEVDFRDLLTSFAISRIERDKVTIQFGLPHGCEAARGNYTEFEIQLNIPKDKMKIFKKGKVLSPAAHS